MKDWSGDLIFSKRSAGEEYVVMSVSGVWYSEAMFKYTKWFQIDGGHNPKPFSWGTPITLNDLPIPARLVVVKYGWMFDDPMAHHTDRNGAKYIEFPNETT